MSGSVPGSFPGGNAEVVIGGCLIEARIGGGGMGLVFRARDLEIDRQVAVKVIRPEWLSDRRARERFQREIALAASIEHPNVVPVYRAGYDPSGQFFLVMRWIRGRDLAGIEDEAAVPAVRAVRLITQISRALQSVHDAGMVHRDVKPQNVLVEREGLDDEHAYLTDFGIAKALQETSNLTGMGVVGTFGYMAPEVVAGRPATPASDQYSLGVLSYELLFGGLPNQLTLTSSAGGGPLAAPVLTALSAEQSDRFATVREFAAELEIAVALDSTVRPAVGGQVQVDPEPEVASKFARLRDRNGFVPLREAVSRARRYGVPYPFRPGDRVAVAGRPSWSRGTVEKTDEEGFLIFVAFDEGVDGPNKHGLFTPDELAPT